jgi:hypothetical protein
MTSSLFTPRRTSSGREVVDAGGVRAVFIPSRDHAPEVLNRRAIIIASALAHDAIAAPSVRVVDDEVRIISVSDGPLLLADFVYSRDPGSRDIAQARASAFTDGYLVARRLCLGERE